MSVYPALLPEIEAENPEFTFILVDRDQYLDLAKLWDIYGIPSLVVLDGDWELGRFVNRDRKTKAQISEFFSRIEVGERERMIVTYNKEQVGDVLMITLKNSGDAKLAVERKGKVARVYREDKQETVAWNIF